MTKIWPEDVFPLQPVGRMVLNRNPDNFFNENEQLAFCPAIVVPGVWGVGAAVSARLSLPQSEEQQHDKQTHRGGH